MECAIWLFLLLLFAKFIKHFSSSALFSHLKTSEPWFSNRANFNSIWMYFSLFSLIFYLYPQLCYICAWNIVSNPNVQRVCRSIVVCSFSGSFHSYGTKKWNKLGKTKRSLKVYDMLQKANSQQERVMCERHDVQPRNNNWEADQNILALALALAHHSPVHRIH